MRRIEYVGRKFGRLTVISRQDVPDKAGDIRPVLTCLCECGTEKQFTASNLYNNTTSSCGCLQKELLSKRSRKPPGHAATHSVWSYYRRNAKLRDLPWNLTKEEFVNLISSPCSYCGTVNSMFVKMIYGDECYHNGVDRIDSKLGYNLTNCSPCCNVCNRAKSDMSRDEFVKWIERLKDR